MDALASCALCVAVNDPLAGRWCKSSKLFVMGMPSLFFSCTLLLPLPLPLNTDEYTPRLVKKLPSLNAVARDYTWASELPRIRIFWKLCVLFSNTPACEMTTLGVYSTGVINGSCSCISSLLLLLDMLPSNFYSWRYSMIRSSTDRRSMSAWLLCISVSAEVISYMTMLCGKPFRSNTHYTTAKSVERGMYMCRLFALPLSECNALLIRSIFVLIFVWFVVNANVLFTFWFAAATLDNMLLSS